MIRWVVPVKEFMRTAPETDSTPMCEADTRQVSSTHVREPR